MNNNIILPTVNKTVAMFVIVYLIPRVSFPMIEYFYAIFFFTKNTPIVRLFRTETWRFQRQQTKLSNVMKRET